MNLVQRIQDILLKPKDTWPQIAAEPATVQSLYKEWLLILAAIPAVAGFIGLSVIGMGGFGFSYRVPFVSGLVHMVLSYVMSLGMVYLLSLLVNALAPTFGGTPNPLAALKLVAYGCTAGFVGGVFQLLPSLSVLGLLCGLYSIYLIYLGLPVLMHNPPEKSAGYTAVVIVAGIVAGLVVGAVTSAVLGIGTWGSGHAGGGGGAVTIKGPGGDVTLDTSKMEAAAKRMEALGKQMEEAQAKGDGAAAGKALGEMMGAMSGATGGGKPMPAADLKALLPENLGDFKRNSIEAQSGGAIGINSSSAKARYGNGDKSISLDITDMGSLAGMAGLAGWAQMTLDKEADGRVERVFKQGDRTVREEYRKDGTHAELTVLLPNGVIVEAKGDQVGIDQLRGVLGSVDLNKLASTPRQPG
ncbi:YIP1 family protein [Roseateles sp. NT4]|uniref:Yip1 family protein n=1 Tax=Roseateles sp. NT4 TaxID=3453715 RepID=UPI003EE98C43